MVRFICFTVRLTHIFFAFLRFLGLYGMEEGQSCWGTRLYDIVFADLIEANTDIVLRNNCLLLKREFEIGR